jgi:hypothetical protein
MAAGAIPPPLFFAQRRLREFPGFCPWRPQERLRFKNTLENTTSVDHAI